MTPFIRLCLVLALLTSCGYHTTTAVGRVVAVGTYTVGCDTTSVTLDVGQSELFDVHLRGAHPALATFQDQRIRITTTWKPDFPCGISTYTVTVLP